jgi:hypothetical protein
MEASPGCLDLSGVELRGRDLVRAVVWERRHEGSLVFLHSNCRRRRPGR